LPEFKRKERKRNAETRKEIHFFLREPVLDAVVGVFTNNPNFIEL